MRALRSLPSGMRTMAPRLFGLALIWLGASKCGSSRRYAFTLELSTRQMSLALVRMRSMKSQPDLARPSWPFLSWNRFLPPLDSDMFVCMPLPLMPVTGLGRKLAVRSICAATWRQSSL